MIPYKDTKIILCKWLPNQAEAITLRWFILFKKDNYEKYQNPNYSSYLQAVLDHEYEHVIQQKKYTIFGFVLLYFFSSKRRFKLEIEAYKYQYKYFINRGDSHKRACEIISCYLSSETYFEMISYEDAYKFCLTYFK